MAEDGGRMPRGTDDNIFYVVGGGGLLVILVGVGLIVAASLGLFTLSRGIAQKHCTPQRHYPSDGPKAVHACREPAGEHPSPAVLFGLRVLA